ncbi:MAG: iron-regulated protein [Deltaproteobacteria bacterium]|jgi:putative iron-regulated protein|nr:iron-regulated protein [Deltaproteobacteria bacterium]
MRGRTVLLLLVVGSGAGACGGDEEAPTGPTQAEIVSQYAKLVDRNYQEVVRTAEALDQAIQAFVADRTPAKLEAAKTAWLAARVPYGQTEAFRFYDGPIDDPVDGPEGRINPWPLDEAYIDRVPGADHDNNIIGDTTVTLDAETLGGLNEGGEGDVFGAGGNFNAEASIALGYHAIEFMLWGQDQNSAGPGTRPATDFLEPNGTLPNGNRRAQFLSVVSTILVADLRSVATQWASGGAYRSSFEADATTSLKKLMGGMGILAKGELGSERMDVALTTKDQEDEHSCFSDNTHVDFRMNMLGIQNVYLGRYGDLDGPGVQDLLRSSDAALEADMTAHLADLVATLDGFSPPVDQAISDSNSVGFQTLSSVVGKLYEAGDKVAAAAQAIGLGTISVELPE